MDKKIQEALELFRRYVSFRERHHVEDTSGYCAALKTAIAVLEDAQRRDAGEAQVRPAMPAEGRKETVENAIRLIDADMPQADRAELFGGLVDVVEDWLEEKGFSPKDFPNDDREGDFDEAIIYGEDYDRLADGFAGVIGISRDCPEIVRGKDSHGC